MAKMKFHVMMNKKFYIFFFSRHKSSSQCAVAHNELKVYRPKIHQLSMEMPGSILCNKLINFLFFVFREHIIINATTNFRQWVTDEKVNHQKLHPSWAKSAEQQQIAMYENTFKAQKH